MKAKIHPKFNKNAKFTCLNCSSVFDIGSTTDDVKVEICSKCHHFWTGEDKNISSANRVDRFAKRMQKKDKANTK